MVRIFLVLFAVFTTIYCKTIIRTVAGIPPFGWDGKLATSAYMYYPSGIYVTSKNETFIVEERNHIVRKIDKNGIINTIAGTPGRLGFSGDYQQATNARLFYPTCVFVEEETNELFICDKGNDVVRKVFLSNGTISTIRGCNMHGKECLDYPWSLFVKDREVYICDSGNRVIRKLFQNGTMEIIAGKWQVEGYGGDHGPATNALFRYPRSIYVTAKNEIYIADMYNKNIRKIFANNTIVTLVGRNDSTLCNDEAIVPVSQARFCNPESVFVDEELDEVYIADSDQCNVRKVVNGTIVQRVAGQNHCGYTGDNQLAVASRLYAPNGVFVTPQKDVFIAEYLNHVVRRVGSDGIIHTIAGYNIKSDELDNNIKESKLSNTYSVWVAVNGTIFVAESSQVKMIQNQNISIIVGNTYCLYLNDESQELYIADSGRNQIFSYQLQTQNLSTIAGNGLLFDTGTLSSQISLKAPTSIFLSNTQLYIADSGNSVVRRIFLSNQSSEIVAGVYKVDGYSGDGGPASNATLDDITSVVVSPSNDLYIVQRSFHSLVRKVFSNGTITTFIGGSERAVIQNSFSSLQSACIDKYQNIMYVVENFAIWKVFLINDTMIRIAGQPRDNGFSGENRDPLEANFGGATSCSVSETGALYILDTGAKVIRKINTLCQEYSFHSSLTIRGQSLGVVEVSSEISKSCRSQVADTFDPEYLPIVSINSKHFDVVRKDVVLDWNTPLQFPIGLKSTYLDLVTVTLNACTEQYGIVSNCSNSTEYGIIPTTDSFFLPNDKNPTGVDFFYFYQMSPFVKEMSILLEFYNTKYHQIDKKVSVYPLANDKRTIEIHDLSCNTLYNVSIATFVKYENEMQYQVISNRVVETKTGLPTAENTSAMETVLGITVHWRLSCISPEGNMILRVRYKFTHSIVYQQLDSKYEIENSTIIPIAHFNYASGDGYELQLSVCSDQWQECVNSASYFKKPQHTDTKIDDSNPLLWLLVLIIPIIASAVFILICIVVIVVLYKKKKSANPKIHEDVAAELQEFLVVETHLDLSHSVLLGSGASGSVFTARYFNNDVAIKLFSKTVVGGLQNDLQDFKNELAFLKNNSQHRNIIRYFGMYENSTSYGLVMEYCPNGTLAHYISTYSLSFEEKIQILSGIASGMQYLHFYNIAHRDLKCENILLDSSLTPKIIDFGYSRVINERANQSLHLTMNIGTAAYCAPEVIKSQLQTPLVQQQQPQDNNLQEPLLSNDHNQVKLESNKSLVYDKKCDVYSFAIVMYVVYFQNKSPYGTMSDFQILLQIAKQNHFRPKFDESAISPTEKWFITLMKQCWSTNPNHRPTFEQIYAQLTTRE